MLYMYLNIANFSISPELLFYPSHFVANQVHEEFAWFPLEEAAALTPVFRYIMTTDIFRKFANLPALEVKKEPVAAVTSPATPGRRGRR